MKNSQIIISWLTTVLIGSFILSIIIALFELRFEFESFFGIVILASMFATAFSIPAVIAFVVFNNRYSKNILDNKLYKKKMMLLHCIVGAIYFFSSLLFIFFLGFDEEALYILLALLFSYLPAGIIIWYILLSRDKSILFEDIIDD